MSDARKPNDVRRLLEEITEARFELEGFYYDTPVRPVPRPPASPQDLSTLANHLRARGLPFPPSYREFLAAADGMAHFERNLDLRSAREVMQPPDEEREEDFPELARFVIGEGDTPAFMSFDPATADASEEMQVVRIADDGAESRYPSFGELLRKTIATLQRKLAKQRADRQSLGE